MSVSVDSEEIARYIDSLRTDIPCSNASANEIYLKSLSRNDAIVAATQIFLNDEIKKKEQLEKFKTTSEKVRSSVYGIKHMQSLENPDALYVEFIMHGCYVFKVYYDKGMTGLDVWRQIDPDNKCIIKFDNPEIGTSEVNLPRGVYVKIEPITDPYIWGIFREIHDHLPGAFKSLSDDD